MGWLSGWAKRVKLTADSAVIDADLADFPALLYISSSSGKNTKDLTFVFDEVGANSKKIAVTKSDGTTECYVEIETWDAVGEKAWLWAKHPTLDADADEDYYLYFDNTHADNATYVGVLGSAPAMNVWDANFQGVWHMKDLTTSTVEDSTGNSYDGTKAAANRPIEIAGKIGKGQDFEADTSDYVNIGDQTNLKFTSSHTVEAWIKLESAPGNFHKSPFSKDDGTGNTGIFMSVYGSTPRFYVGGPAVMADSTINTGTWYYLAGVHDDAGNLTWIYINTTGKSIANSANPNTGTSPAYIGRWATVYFDGIIDEVRVSNTNRSAAWIKASYNSGNDSLWTWGNMETPPVVGKSPLICDVGRHPRLRTIFHKRLRL